LKNPLKTVVEKAISAFSNLDEHNGWEDQWPDDFIPDERVCKQIGGK